MLELAKIYMSENKIKKATKWIKLALSVQPKLGDAWAYYYLISNVEDGEES